MVLIIPLQIMVFDHLNCHFMTFPHPTLRFSLARPPPTPAHPSTPLPIPMHLGPSNSVRLWEGHKQLSSTVPLQVSSSFSLKERYQVREATKIISEGYSLILFSFRYRFTQILRGIVCPNFSQLCGNTDERPNTVWANKKVVFHTLESLEGKCFHYIISLEIRSKLRGEPQLLRYPDPRTNTSHLPEGRLPQKEVHLWFNPFTNPRVSGANR